MNKPKKHLRLRGRNKILLSLLRKVREAAKKGLPHYVPYVDLVIKHLYLLKRESEYTQELYRQIIARTFGNKFKEFIMDSSIDDTYGWAITRHNEKVQAEFLMAGVNFRQWLDYDVEEKIEALEYKTDKGGDARWQYLRLQLDDFLHFLEKTPLYGSLRKDCIEILKKKALILRGDYLIPEEWRESIFPKFYLTLKRSQWRGNIGGTAEEFGAAENEIKMILGTFSKNQIKKKFMVRLWRREPRYDLLQGNFSDCCVAIGEKDKYPAVHLPEVSCRKFPPGIVNYLTDLGIQVAEVHDLAEPEKQIGQCWLFVSMDDDGKPVLVADSFDLQSEYRSSESQGSAIRDCMFDFLKRYAAKCGISKVILGREGSTGISRFKTDERGRDVLKKLPIYEAHVIHNDIPVENMPVVNFQTPIEKLGGFFPDRTYFLETRGGKNAYLIADNLPITAVEKMRAGLMARVSEYVANYKTQKS
jgi:hypothetical protein